ncbi:MAG TPA: S8 family peptidase [Aquabacterium sp.]|nr:S8 family peptidase [Aquabacterium sp.]
MATQVPDRRRHLFPTGTKAEHNYVARSGGDGDGKKIPEQPRVQHAMLLRAQLAAIALAQQAQVVQQRSAGMQASIGLQVEFASRVDVALAAESLARDNQGIELLNVRQQGQQTLATVFVPEGKLAHFEGLLADYASYRTDKNGKALGNQPLIDAIARVSVATFDSLWTDTDEALPSRDEEAIWWEAWLPAREPRSRRLQEFRQAAERAGFTVSQRTLDFPERVVAQLHGTKLQWLAAPLLTALLAEIRRAKTTAAFFTSQTRESQAEWTRDLLQRLRTQADTNNFVTLLDTGVNHGHPLLEPLIQQADLHTVQPGWGVHDANGHGTELAGLALLGDLTAPLEGQSELVVGHRLESVKVLRDEGDNQGESFGAITMEAVGRVEVAAPDRQRVFSMAVTSTDGRDRGRPSSWSAQIDRLASELTGGGDQQRLFVLSAGNTMDAQDWKEHPGHLLVSGIHDPGQAWNALTVGAFTELTTLAPADLPHCSAIAGAGALSPYTTTSVTWQDEWPFKPDIVMEGGNVGLDSRMGLATRLPSLSLLTTSHKPHEELFACSWATSAASALAAGMTAKISSAYPEFWPETTRALMVHSARWTPAMLQAYLPGGRGKGEALKQILRHCGYGVPSLERALYSASNSLTLIVQDELQPFKKPQGKSIETNHMHLHDLPWPRELLRSLGAVDVILRVTLSYFIEPNPGDRAGVDKYAYQSHGLRFAVRRTLENSTAFAERINAAVNADVKRAKPPADSNWLIGERLRTRGSLVSDSWKGSAADLAERGLLAVFPVNGWWRTRPGLNAHARKARYSLVVSIEAPEVETDIYADVAQRIAQAATVMT